jgi:hypothetical protein
VKRRDIVWILAGTVLREAPSPTAREMLRFEAIANAIRLERRGDWFRVHHTGSEGWVHLPGYDEEGIPYGEEPDAPGPLLPRPPDEQQLAAARKLLGERERTTRLGPYTTYSDCRDKTLLAHLDRLAAQVETAYRQRYGLQPLGEPRAAIVLYGSELPYRLLQQQSEQIAGLNASGHNQGGLALLYVGDRSRLEVAGTLIHELVHLLNRRALGPALPPWLDEGLADDLAASRVGPDGTLRPQQLSGDRHHTEKRLWIDGALAALHQLHQAKQAGRLLSLAELGQLEWERFVEGERIRLHYSLSAFWVRYLVQGEEGRYSDAFRHFLTAVAAGKPASVEQLGVHLGADPSSLEPGFLTWLSTLETKLIGNFFDDASS